MYRILERHDQVRERRDVRRHPRYSKPQLVSTGPNQVWSWDITKLLGPHKWVYYQLYVLLDIFSRLVVGWLLAERESAELAKRLIAESYVKQGIVPGQVTLHADRGTAMTAKNMAQKLADLGISESHSRPRVSNDNPFSESQFKTLTHPPAPIGAVIDIPQQLGLALEPGEALGIARDRLRQDLDGDRPLEVRIGGPIHLTHPARSDRAVISCGPKRVPGVRAKGSTGSYGAEPTAA